MCRTVPRFIIRLFHEQRAQGLAAPADFCTLPLRAYIPAYIHISTHVVHPPLPATLTIRLRFEHRPAGPPARLPPKKNIKKETALQICRRVAPYRMSSVYWSPQMLAGPDRRRQSGVPFHFNPIHPPSIRHLRNTGGRRYLNVVECTIALMLAGPDRRRKTGVPFHFNQIHPPFIRHLRNTGGRRYLNVVEFKIALMLAGPDRGRKTGVPFHFNQIHPPLIRHLRNTGGRRYLNVVECTIALMLAGPDRRRKTGVPFHFNQIHPPSRFGT
ncbi:hypothetical protein C8F04DRAFT_1175833 [Mycena alexandri]|uniref:Uncharacterized protein n=1 Tax=Mycena alexandri TaxID=1745969 RepID=A0AAD6X872_9AGAR|nr:hypothetical protein C8F04DRAFT_1175833 [Mycena alexandri]